MQTQGNRESQGECMASSHAGGPGFESLRAHHYLSTSLAPRATPARENTGWRERGEALRDAVSSSFRRSWAEPATPCGEADPASALHTSEDYLRGKSLRFLRAPTTRLSGTRPPAFSCVLLFPLNFVGVPKPRNLNGGGKRQGEAMSPAASSTSSPSFSKNT